MTTDRRHSQPPRLPLRHRRARRHARGAGDWAEAAANGAATRPPLKGDQLSSYITIEPDGTVVAYYGKIDGGQGLGTSIAQMVAEEIDVAFERVHVVMGDSGAHARHGRRAARRSASRTAA